MVLLLLVVDPDVLLELSLDVWDATAPRGGGGGGDEDDDDDCEEPDFGGGGEEEDCAFPGDEVGDWVDVGGEGVEDEGGEDALVRGGGEVEEGGGEAGVALVGDGAEVVEFDKEVGDVVFVEFEDIFVLNVL